MYFITEKKNFSSTFFEKRYIGQDNRTFTTIVCIRNANVTLDNISYTYLYDSNMNVISSVFQFINFKLQSASPNHRSLAINALKFLHSFLELYSLTLESLNENDINNLILFLEGIPKIGTLYNLNLSTQRSPRTINNYFAIYRQYVTYLGYDDSIFLKKNDYTHSAYIPESETTIEVTSYSARKKDYHPEISAPHYISVPEFKDILHVIRKKYTLREECIVRLAFECGLRIGEILGLTNEDIIEKNGSIILKLRNRLTDSSDQLAKTCMNVINRKEYDSKKYNTKGVGYQTVVISSHLADKLIDYINTYHYPRNKKFEFNYSKYTIADNVDEKTQDNFYIFINSLGKPLSANLWNKTLRTIFTEAGVSVDKGGRQTNLNHRFRHGFAMFMVKYKHIDIYELQILLRHRSLSSVQKYYRPTDDDIIELKSEFINSVYDIIPELSE